GSPLGPRSPNRPPRAVPPRRVLAGSYSARYPEKRLPLDAMAHTGKGYGTAATDLVLEHAFTVVGLHRVALQVFEYNTNARRSYAGSGARGEGRWREFLYWDGAWHDAILMSILAHEYAELRSGRVGV